MGVLAVGLLGVAALIPAGRHQIAQGTRMEYAAEVGRGAVREMQIRRMLDPRTWYVNNGGNALAVWHPSFADGNTFGPQTPLTIDNMDFTDQLAVAIDPLGIQAGYSKHFPFSSIGNAPRTMGRVAPFDPTATNAPRVADLMFRSSLDLLTEPNRTNRELPPLQFFFKDASNNPLRRASDGSYSWLATVVCDPTKSRSINTTSNALRGDMTVSVAVFHKRTLASAGEGEVIITDVSPPVAGLDLELSGIPTSRTVKPGEWLMVAHTRLTVPNVTTFQWYRVLSATAKASDTQTVTLWGRGHFPRNPLPPNPPEHDYDVWLFDNVVNVYEKTMPLEID